MKSVFRLRVEMSEERDGATGGVGLGAASSRWLPNPHFDKYSTSQLLVNNATPHHHHKLHQNRGTKQACPRPARKWVTGGPGMQAVFLDSDTTNNNNKSCGTGVFLPRITADTKTKKPGRDTYQLPASSLPIICSTLNDFDTLAVSSCLSACSPVLLPSRVVQALNLNVHDLVTSSPESKEFSMRKKTREAASSSSSSSSSSNIFSEKECLLPDIFLPKEWTY